MTVDLPPLTRHLLRLRFTRPAAFHFHHGGVLRGALSAALRQHALPEGILPFACEMGHVRYERGDGYHLGLTLIGDVSPLLDRIVSGLRSLGSTNPPSDAPLPTLAGNFEVEAVDALPAPDLDPQLARCAGSPSLTLRFLSPLRLERPVADRAASNRYVTPDDFPGALLLERLWNRLFHFREGRYPTHDERQQLRPPLPELPPAVTAMTWLDLPVEGAGRRKRPLSFRGLLGTARLDGVPDEWVPVLLAGQYLHLGEATLYGLGCYRVVEAGTLTYEAFRPARTYLAQIAREEALRHAMGHVGERSEAAGVDRVSPEAFMLRADELLPELAEGLATGSYQPSHLLGFLGEKKSGGVRPLAIPTVADRVAQRAACEAMGPAVEALLEDCSFAYRKDLSRAGAAAALQQAYDEGYRWVLDADITSFFDCVDWARLFAKLEALFPFEPLVSLLEEWVRVPVHFDGRLLLRTRGLPQGAGVSPLLANLFLDELDETMLGKDFRIVRFADDFVVACRDLERAEQARVEARAALERLGLSLNDQKTEVRSLDHGFTYLGYLFCRSLVLDAAPERKGAAELAPDAVPAASWLAQVPFDRIKALARPGPAARRDAPQVVPLADEPTVGDDGRVPLYVASPATQLQLSGETLLVHSPETGEQRWPIRSLSHLVFLGRVRASLPLLVEAAQLGVPTYFCHRNGELLSVFGPHQPDWPLWMAQARFADNEPGKVAFAREVTAAKLHNAATLAVRFGWLGREALAQDLRQLERSCANQTTLESLRGLEGRGAALYFAALAEQLDAEWQFRGRRKNPPPDPVNAMLSFGYTLLHNRIATALYAAGLNPRIGLLHEPRGAHQALASDLEEEFRCLVEAEVWSLVRRREVHSDDFGPSPDGTFPCLLTTRSRIRFIEALEGRFAQSFTPEDGLPTTYRQFFDHQARRLRDLVNGTTSRYRPSRLHA